MPEAMPVTPTNLTFNMIALKGQAKIEVLKHKNTLYEGVKWDIAVLNWQNRSVVNCDVRLKHMVVGHLKSSL